MPFSFITITNTSAKADIEAMYHSSLMCGPQDYPSKSKQNILYLSIENSLTLTPLRVYSLQL